MLEKKDEYADCHPEIRQGMLYLTQSALQYAVNICCELPSYSVSIVVNWENVVDTFNNVLEIYYKEPKYNKYLDSTSKNDTNRITQGIHFSNNSDIIIIPDEILGCGNIHWGKINEIIVDRDVCINGNKFGLKCYQTCLFDYYDKTSWFPFKHPSEYTN